ncbi:hypothetical protein EYF80_016919 [Liparis tanakae]|uniref:Uncharacterized protein n=1 Tax=Liparis tanakae TaxID=230148 RepID=A0A4Z2I4C1_9TELE|nr:hypothetical protein EYF80_016919 [Liparis tanakae]
MAYSRMVMAGTSLTSFSAENVTPDLVSTGADWFGLPSSLQVDRCFRREEAPASLCLFSSECSHAVSERALVVQGDSKHFPSQYICSEAAERDETGCSSGDAFTDTDREGNLMSVKP